MKNKFSYKSIFISDLHLGLESSNVELLIELLETIKTENLYIVGDFIDFMHLHEHKGWSGKCNLLIRRILSKVNKGTKVKICIGNHDAFLGVIKGFKFGNIEIASYFIHHNQFIDYLVIHGDEFDHSIRTAAGRILAYIYSHLEWSKLVKYIRNYIDKKTERYINIKEMEEFAIEKGTQGIIYGHTHNPHKTTSKIILINCGDLVKSNTAVIEHNNGEMEVVLIEGFLNAVKSNYHL